MNDDEKNQGMPNSAAAEMEARIVALVAGEASAFETAEIERAIAANPELAIFKRRIEAVGGLVGEAVKPDSVPLVMSPERRAKLLQVLGSTEANPPGAGATDVKPVIAPMRKARRTDLCWLGAIAATVAIGFFSIFSFTNSSRQLEAGKEEQIMMALPPAQLDSADATDLEARQKAPESGHGFYARPPGVNPADFKAEAPAKGVAANGFLGDVGGKNNAGLLRYTAQTEVGGFMARRNAVAAAPLPQGSATQNNPDALSLVGPPAEADEKPIVLSPFAVSAPEDIGYSAKSTLAGTRIRTDLKDASSAISVVTKQFLDDTGKTNDVPANGESSVAAESERDEGADKTRRASLLQISEGEPAKKQDAAPTSLAKEEAKRAADPDQPLPAPPKPTEPDTETPEVTATKQPVSTFSLHVSDVSFRLAQAALARNESLDETSIRPEEFYNAFDYGDPAPSMAEKVSCRIEQSAHPFLQQRNLVRIAVKVPATGRDATQALRLTVLLDTSGSMEREDRAAIAKRAVGALASLLGPNDRLTLIGFSRRPRLLAESLPGDQAKQALAVMANTPAEGGTNLEEALKLGTELAGRQFQTGAQNRIVLLTDGAANLGDANPGRLAGAIAALRQKGIAFDACGVGLDGLDDAMLERLTRNGAGRYYVLNSPDEADAGFARQLAGAFHPAAENVKLQVRFNPARVGNYRLVGFEQHRLREEDFRDDNVGTATLAAEEAAVAVYQVETLPQGEGELGEVYVRFRDTAAGNVVERSWTLSYDANAPSFDQATPTMQLAGTAAMLAEKLRDGEAGEAVKLAELAPVINRLRAQYAGEERVQQLVAMYEQMRRRSGE